jgi:hypothetical protein
MPNHGACTQMSFCPEIPKLRVLKFLKFGLLQLWRLIISYEDLWLRWSLKKCCSPCQELFDNITHVTCTQVNQGDSQLLMVGSQIFTLIFDPSFGHNLCFKYPNGSCKPILNIYIPRSFRWHKENFNPMSFDPCNRPLKIQEFIRTPTSKVEDHLGVWGFIPSNSSTFPGSWNVTPRLHFWPTPFQTFAFNMSPRFGL